MLSIVNSGYSVFFFFHRVPSSTLFTCLFYFIKIWLHIWSYILFFFNYFLNFGMILPWDKSGRGTLERSHRSLCPVFPNVHSIRYCRQNWEPSIGTGLLTKPGTFCWRSPFFPAMSFFWSWTRPRTPVKKSTSQVVCRMFPHLCWSGIFVTIRPEFWVARVGGRLGRLSKRRSSPL